MKVLLVGYHNPNFVNTIVYREKALGYLGHEVIFLNEADFFLPGRIRDWFLPLQQWDLERLNQRLIDWARKNRPEVCVVVGGHTMLPQTVFEIKRMGIRIALWTTDVPLNFRNVLECASIYTHLFCAGSEAVDIFYGCGLKNVTWLPFACDPQYHRRVTLDIEEYQRYSKDVVFVGSFYPNRAKLLESVSDYNLGVWGPYWEKLNQGSPLKSKAVNIKMNYDQWVQIFNACKINLVVHYHDDRVACHQASPKLFEALACGCFVISDRQKDAEVLFKDREHLVFFDDEKDLRSKIDHYLERPQERRRISNAGYNQVTHQHTYQHRMKKIIEVLSGH